MLTSARSLLIPRTLTAALLLLGLLCAGWVAGEPPKKPRPPEEEEEPVKPGKVIKVDDPMKVPPTTRKADETPEVDLVIAQAKARTEAIRRLFEALAVPHDDFTFSGGRTDHVQPVPDYVSDLASHKEMFHLVPLKSGDKPYDRAASDVSKVRYYERMALEDVQAFLKAGYEGRPPGDPERLSRHEQLVAAEQALAWALRNHQSLRASKKRVGDGWEGIEAELAKSLLEVREQQLQDLGDAGDWDAAFALVRRLIASYKTPEECAKIARPLEEILKKALASGDISGAALRESRRRLREVVDQSPDNPIIRPIRDSLKAQAEALLQAAKLKGKDERTLSQAEDLVDQAQEAYPELPDLREYRITLKKRSPKLRVGVREWPKWLAPAVATTDDELRASELLYEGLMKLSPNADGTLRYRSALAEGRPRLVAMGRQFQLPRGFKWSDGKMVLEAADVRFTLRELRKGVRLGGPPAWVEQLLEEDVNVGADPYQVTLSLKQGFLDSLAPMTFKIIPRDVPPRGELEDLDKKELISSGPFVYSHLHEDGKDGRKYMLFAANPLYGTRPGKSGLPHIQEVRFYVSTDPVKDLESGKIHLALDLTPEQADAVKKGGQAEVLLPSPLSYSNRRIYFLALNQDRALLKDVNVRRALVCAINREQVLSDCFRGPLGTAVHKAINGPFPAGSWACSQRVSKGKGPADSLDQFDLDKAKAYLAAASPGVPINSPLKLKYCEEDPALDKIDTASKLPVAMVKLKQQVKAALGMELELVPCKAKDLREAVERTGDYDLAYYHYDFPDDTYWLWPLLGPNNMLRLPESPGVQEMEAAMRDAMGHRDFGKVKGHMQILHDVVAREVPFVPLWQLDPLIAWSKAVHPPASFDPLLVFTDAEEWRVDAED
jgi:peptide/nickel transport system substrate-binding protein